MRIRTMRKEKLLVMKDNLSCSRSIYSNYDKAVYQKKKKKKRRKAKT